jgi:hypothetical protein
VFLREQDFGVVPEYVLHIIPKRKEKGLLLGDIWWMLRHTASGKSLESRLKLLLSGSKTCTSQSNTPRLMKCGFPFLWMPSPQFGFWAFTRFQVTIWRRPWPFQVRKTPDEQSLLRRATAKFCLPGLESGNNCWEIRLSPPISE